MSDAMGARWDEDNAIGGFGHWKAERSSPEGREQCHPGGEEYILKKILVVRGWLRV